MDRADMASACRGKWPRNPANDVFPPADPLKLSPMLHGIPQCSNKKVSSSLIPQVLVLLIFASLLLGITGSPGVVTEPAPQGGLPFKDPLNIAGPTDNQSTDTASSVDNPWDLPHSNSRPPQDSLSLSSEDEPQTLPFHPDHIPDTSFGLLSNHSIPPFLIRRLIDFESSNPTKQLVTANLYGGIYDFAYYFVSLLIGTPPQRQSVIVDSGSSLLGFPCSTCVRCGKEHMDRGFDFSSSQTASWLSCYDPKCVTICGAGDACSYQQRYSEGSSIEGRYFSDLLALGEQDRKNEFIRYDHIGCHTKETNLFTSQRASGIMGVSYPKNGRQETVMDALFQSPYVDSKIFAICASEEGGVMTVGGFNSSVHITSRTLGSPNLRLLGLSQSLKHDAVMRDWQPEYKESVSGGSFRRGLLEGEGGVAEMAISESHEMPGGMSQHHPQRQQQQRHHPLLERQFRDFYSDYRRRSLQILEDDAKKPAEGEIDIKDFNVLIGTNPSEDAKINPSRIPIAWTPVISTTAYRIDVLSVRALGKASDLNDIGTEIISAGELGPCIVDSGTTFSYLPPGPFRAFLSVLTHSCDGPTASLCVSRPTTSSDGLCWKIATQHVFQLLPSFLLELRGGAVVEWRPSSYLHRRSRTDIWCLAVDDNHEKNTILGMSFMKGKDLIFDRERDLIGFVEADCPVVKETERPPAPTVGPAPSNASRLTIALLDGFPNRSKDGFSIEEAASSSLETGLQPKPFNFDGAVMWASAGLLVGLAALSMGAIAVKALIGARGAQDYAPMRSEAFVAPDTAVPIDSSSEDSARWERRRPTPLEGSHFDAVQYTAIEAELDALERATRTRV